MLAILYNVLFALVHGFTSDKVPLHASPKPSELKVRLNNHMSRAVWLRLSQTSRRSDGNGRQNARYRSFIK